MGGTIGFTLRHEDGEEFRMSSWTNWTPWAIDNIKLVHKEPKHIADLTATWQKQMKLPAKKRDWPFTSPYLAPVEYGLVVVDMQRNKILDCNRYHLFGRVHSIGLQNEMRATNISESGVTLGGDGERIGLAAFTLPHENEAARWHDFYLERRIASVEQWNNSKKKYVPLNDDVNNWPLEKIVKRLIGKSVEDCPSVFYLDMSPFEVVRFEESAEGFSKYRQAVLDLGFELSKKEHKLWDEKISRFDDDR